MTAERTSIMLRYVGDAAGLEQATADLTAAIPADILFPKVAGFVELLLPSDRAVSLRIPECWHQYTPSYAEVNPPGINLAALRRVLAERKG